MESEQFPPVSRSLVEKLEEMFPDRCPTKPIENFELGKLAGRVEVIAFLRSEMELQDTILNRS